MTNAILRGKPDAGNPHVRFDEGEVASEKPRRGSLLYKIGFVVSAVAFSAGLCFADRVGLSGTFAAPDGLRVLNGFGCKVTRRDGSLVISSETPRNRYSVRFFNPANMRYLFAPRLPKHTNGVITVDFEASVPLAGVRIVTIDGTGMPVSHDFASAELARPGRHVVDVPLKPGKSWDAALGGVEFDASRAFAGAVTIGSFAFHGDVPANETVRLEIDTDDEFHLLTPKTRARGVTASLVNFTDRPSTCSAVFFLEDWQGRRVGPERELAMTLAPGAAKSVTLPCPNDFGAYTVVARVTSADNPGLGAKRLTRIFGYLEPAGEMSGSGDSPVFPMGTVVHLHPYFGHPDEMERMARAMTRIGMKVMRTDCRASTDAEFAEMDRVVEIFGRHGIELDLILPWFADRDGYTDIDACCAFYRKVFSRYKGRVRYWELLNEPDLPWGRKHPPTPREYAKLAERARADLKRLDPAALFMSAGFCCFSQPVCGEFQREAMALCWKNFDIHCFHGHGNYAAFRTTVGTQLRQLRHETGAEGIPWFANETALSSAAVGLARQATTMYKKVVIAREFGSLGYIWYNLRSKGWEQNDSENGYGMMTPELDPKPVYVAWNEMTRLLQDAVFVGRVGIGASLTANRFAKPSADIICLWRDSGRERPLVFSTDAKAVTRVDLFGNRTEIEVRDGSFSCLLTGEPCTFILPKGAAFARVMPREAGGNLMPLEDKLTLYVDSFNQSDEEIYTNSFPNSAAAGLLADSVPLFECPDTDIERTYYFRWWTFRKHIRKITPAGWVLTEFLPPVGWAGSHNTINCAAGHHFMEGRWFRANWLLDGYANFWLTDPKAKMHCPGAYVCWIASAVLERAKVNAGWGFAFGLLPDLVKNFELWEKGWRCNVFPGTGTFPIGGGHDGLFWTTCNYEGSELALGGDGARVHINAVMCGEARAISTLARLKGETALAERFAAKAARLERDIKAKLWNADLGFFVPVATNGTQTLVRELHGYSPWYFKLDLKGYEQAWKPLMEPQGFNSKWGLTFPERRSKGFAISYTGHPCQWNGPVWPYTSSLTLTALANALEAGTAGSVTAADYVELLHRYAAAHVRVCQYGQIVPWIDEVQNPDTGDWISRTMLMAEAKPRYRERGKDYNHSTYCDLVISGLVGVRPREDSTVVIAPLFPADWLYLKLERVAYHGHDLSVAWDRDGMRYGLGKGLFVLLDGRVAARASDLKHPLTVKLDR